MSNLVKSFLVMLSLVSHTSLAAEVTHIMTNGHGSGADQTSACRDAEEQGRLSGLAQCNATVLSFSCSTSYDARQFTCEAQCLTVCEKPTFP